MASTVTKVSEYRKKRQPYEFQVSDDLRVLIKRVDMVGLIVTGAVPMPLMNAADKFEKLRDEITDDTPPEEAIRKLEGAGEDGEFRKFLEHYAAYVVIQPKIFVPGKNQTYHDCPENAIPAEEMGLLELLAIWNAFPTDEEPAPEVAATATFPDGEREPVSSPAPNGESVQPAPKPVDDAKDEFIYG